MSAKPGVFVVAAALQVWLAAVCNGQDKPLLTPGITWHAPNDVEQRIDPATGKVTVQVVLDGHKLGNNGENPKVLLLLPTGKAQLKLRFTLKEGPAGVAIGAIIQENGDVSAVVINPENPTVAVWTRAPSDTRRNVTVQNLNQADKATILYEVVDQRIIDESI